MKRWKGTRALLALAMAAALLLAALPGAASAQEALTLAEYRDLLAAVRSELEAARDAQLTAPGTYRSRVVAARQRVGRRWRVETPHGEMTADHRTLLRLLREAEAPTARGRESLGHALSMVRQMERAAAEVARLSTEPGADAYARLEAILAEIEAWRARTGWLERLLERLFPETEPPPGAQQPAGQSLPAQWAVLILGLTGLAVLGWSLVRNLSGHTGGPDVALHEPDGGERLRPLTPAQMRLSARERAASGDYLEALRLLHRALLLHYDRLGLIRYHPAQTNREHERMLRRLHPDLARPMAQLHDLVDLRLYSGHGATAEDVAAAEALVDELWRGGDEASRRAATEASGASSPA